jgi:hypothetical protein
LTKKILRIDYNYDISIIGISSAARDYRLCWFINNQLPLKFIRIDDLLIYSDFGEESHHSCFRFSLENSETDLYLLSNKSGNSYLVPEMKESDYFIISTENLLEEDVKDLISLLNKIAVIQTAYSIDPYSLKSKENLFFF